MAIRSDLARLLYTKESLKEYERVVWFDIDCLIFAPKLMTLREDLYLFGQERWIQPHQKKKWKIYKNACNAFFQFRKGNPFLDFYIDTAKKIIKKAHPDHIAPQMIGPKLLTALNNVVMLPLTTMVGSASPWLLEECANGGGPLLSRVAQSIHTEPCAALNLCNTLIEDEDSLQQSIDFLKKYGGIHASHL